MNMIRVWGGGFYEFDAFYETCDELGLLVWQDMMFACSQYPSTPDFLAAVDAEVRYQVKRLASHASIALWCGDNEVIGSLNWYDLSKKNRDRYLVNYDRLNRAIEVAVAASDPDRRFWPSSPCSGALDYGDAWHDDSRGDMHFWSVWHESKDFEHYYTVKPRFCSEFGFQAFPTTTVIRRFAEPSQWNAMSPVMEFHQRDRAGNGRIVETMTRYFRSPTSFESFLYLSQLQQALAIETAVRYWRSLKPHSMGALYWQLNDVWPSVSWASLDHALAWKTAALPRPPLLPAARARRPHRGGRAHPFGDERLARAGARRGPRPAPCLRRQGARRGERFGRSAGRAGDPARDGRGSRRRGFLLRHRRAEARRRRLRPVHAARRLAHETQASGPARGQGRASPRLPASRAPSPCRATSPPSTSCRRRRPSTAPSTMRASSSCRARSGRWRSAPMTAACRPSVTSMCVTSPRPTRSCRLRGTLSCVRPTIVTPAKAGVHGTGREAAPTSRRLDKRCHGFRLSPE